MEGKILEALKVTAMVIAGIWVLRQFSVTRPLVDKALTDTTAPII